MKRILTCIIAPLLMWALMAFTPTAASSQVEHQQSKDSTTMVNVKFSPAQIIVNDNRTVEGISAIIQKNTESNSKVAESINTSVDAVMSAMQERRCESIVDRITAKTGLTVKEVEKILHKKRIYDITFYTLFLIYLIIVYFGMIKNTVLSNVINIQELLIKTIASMFAFIALLLIYKYLGNILNGEYYPIIESIIKLPSG
jgi:hypothetical protein